MEIGDKIKVSFTDELLTITDIINGGKHLILENSKGHAAGWMYASEVMEVISINNNLSWIDWRVIEADKDAESHWYTFACRLDRLIFDEFEDDFEAELDFYKSKGWI